MQVLISRIFVSLMWGLASALLFLFVVSFSFCYVIIFFFTTRFFFKISFAQAVLNLRGPFFSLCLKPKFLHLEEINFPRNSRVSLGGRGELSARYPQLLPIARAAALESPVQK